MPKSKIAGRQIFARQGLNIRAWLTIGLVFSLLAGCAVVTPKRTKAQLDAFEKRLDKSLFDAASDAEKRQNFTIAVEFYTQLYKRDTKNLQTIIGLSRSLRSSRRPAEAIGYVQRGLETYKRHPRLMAELGKAQLVLGKPLKGVENLSRSDALEPNKWETIMAMGVGFGQVGLYDKAERQYRRALAVSPGNVMVLNNYGLSLAQSGNLAKAIETLERAANLPEAIPQIRQNLAMLYIMQGQELKAERLIRRDLPPEIALENIETYKRMVRDGSINNQIGGGAPGKLGSRVKTMPNPTIAAAVQPGMVPIEAKYVVLQNAVVRQAAQAGARRLAELQAGNVVHVAARSKDGNWLLVEGADNLRGYVFAARLQPANNTTDAALPAKSTRLPKVLQADLTAKKSQPDIKKKNKPKVLKQAAVKQEKKKPAASVVKKATQPAIKKKSGKQKSPQKETKKLPVVKKTKKSEIAILTSREKTPAKTKPAAIKSPAKKKIRLGASFRDCGQCPELVPVPTGSFTMGSPGNETYRKSREGPQRRVKISRRFAVARFETTFRDWDACVKARGCSHRPDDSRWGRAGRPVINVSWLDAQQYLAWLRKRTGKKYRLLTEAEWEYVARAGSDGPYHTGNAISSGQALFATVRTGGKLKSRRTRPVGKYAANRFGLHDLHGSVREWTEDCRHGNYNNAPSDARAWLKRGNCDYRVIRGGSWADRAALLRSSYRSWTKAKNRSYIVGFRVARDLD